MNKIIAILVTALLVVPVLVNATQMEDIDAHPSCSYCGMKRQMS